MKKTVDERLEALELQMKSEEKKLQQLQNRKKDLMKQRNEAERKARTHRLIVLGGAIEAALNRPVPESEAERIAAVIAASEKNGSADNMAFVSAIEDVLKRPVTDEDFFRFRSYLGYQEDRGRYFSRFMNRESN